MTNRLLLYVEASLWKLPKCCVKTGDERRIKKLFTCKNYGKLKEIRTVSGEPNYKSVNLTWEVEFVPSAAENDDAVTNSSAEVEPPKAFQIFFCELQSFGPQRCRSRLVNDTQHVEMTMNDNNNNNDNNMDIVEENNRQVRHYNAQIENLRMATKYSFHIRPQQKRRNMKITGRSEIFGNEIENDLNALKNFGGQTIIIPTKGFAAQATKCLPHASEIEVETGPYFGGKIVVDGGNCGVKGNTEDPTEKYTMRIDHKMCGSMVKPETNTVETFITVQENLGIFTHSTRRFVVVCSFQSGMQTVRASFTVPGKDGVAAPVQNDPFEADERLSREQRQMRYVDKSSLVLKEHYDDLSGMELENGKDSQMETDSRNVVSEENEALVEELQDPALNITTGQQHELLSSDSKDDAANSVAVLEDIIPGVNEEHIKHENEGAEQAEHRESATHSVPVAHARSAKYAKLVGEKNDMNAAADQEWFNLSDAGADGRAYASSLHYISSNIGSIVVTVSLTVIIIGIFIFIVYREAHRQRFIKRHSNMQQQQEQTRHQQQQQHNHLQHKTMPRSLQPKL